MLVALEREAEGHAMCKDPGRWDVPNRCHRDLRLFCRAILFSIFLNTSRNAAFFPPARFRTGLRWFYNWRFTGVDWEDEGFQFHNGDGVYACKACAEGDFEEGYVDLSTVPAGIPRG